MSKIKKQNIHAPEFGDSLIFQRNVCCGFFLFVCFVLVGFFFGKQLS